MVSGWLDLITFWVFFLRVGCVRCFPALCCSTFRVRVKKFFALVSFGCSYSRFSVFELIVWSAIFWKFCCSFFLCMVLRPWVRLWYRGGC